MKKRTLISILNWNNAAKTIECIRSLEMDIAQGSGTIEVTVIDNGSERTDELSLIHGLVGTDVRIVRLEQNIGFTGGHNISIRYAIDNGFEYIWLLNNDATVKPGCMEKLIAALELNPECGAVSPVILPEGSGELIAAWGGAHNWITRETGWFQSKAQSEEAHRYRPNEIFVAGTAVLIRVVALKETGVLDDRLFAYFDDSDLGVRLASKGWLSKVVFDAEIKHGWRNIDELPPYFFYLITRNEMIFWYTHMPLHLRRLLWFKLINQALYNAARLKRRKLKAQSNAVLLGISDFIVKRHGRPELDREPSVLMKLAILAAEVLYRKQIERFR